MKAVHPASEDDGILSANIPPEMAGERLDKILARLFPEFSRMSLTQWIREGHVQVDGATWRPRDKARGGEQVRLRVVREEKTGCAAQDIPLDIVHEDEALLVIDKPAGLVVHPGAGNPQDTMMNALLHHAPELAELPRAGIVHRLDKDTSGLLVVARSLQARKHLEEQIATRTFEREYHALVNGVMTSGGTIDAPIGRHPHQRTRMAVREGGRAAVSHYRVMERLRVHTLVKVMLETGRTHQIRVHMAHIRHPLVGDPVYGGRLRLPPDCGTALRDILQGFRRQALHAARLAVTHPLSGERLSWESPWPADMLVLLEALREDAAGHG
ncbi:MAG TPA: 23S rRNA pseudouridine(1911/1915/1917) synthase RluD [Gammaproteobacteria bacterium]|nr:23S rRNA pseudouridine(1911/1915/1917) synthase RluD [Gammaproteobacteria bacterium]